MKTISPTGHYLAEKGCKYQQEITLLTLPLTVQSDPAGGIINQFILGSHHKKKAWPGKLEYLMRLIMEDLKVKFCFVLSVCCTKASS